jgi:hypothetical protein
MMFLWWEIECCINIGFIEKVLVLRVSQEPVSLLAGDIRWIASSSVSRGGFLVEKGLSFDLKVDIN